MGDAPSSKGADHSHGMSRTPWVCGRCGLQMTPMDNIDRLFSWGASRPDNPAPPGRVGRQDHCERWLTS